MESTPMKMSAAKFCELRPDYRNDYRNEQIATNSNTEGKNTTGKRKR
jgi:hypothetical protein